jgi:hypothetical protein
MIQIKLDGVEDLRRKKESIWNALMGFCLAGGGVLQLITDIRSLRQNSKLWPLLTDFSKQVVYLGQKRSKEDWKVIMMSAWRIDTKEQKPDLVPGLRGEFICLNYSTSKLGKKDFCSFIEFVYSVGLTEFSVVFSDKAMDAYATYREALE